MTKELTCKAITENGDSCNNTATYPEDNPVVCYLKSHQKQLEEIMVVENKEEKEMPTEKKTHIFSCTSLHQVVFVDTDKEVEDGERDYFRVDFEEGKYETLDDKKAELLMKKVNEFKQLKTRVTKVQ